MWGVLNQQLRRVIIFISAAVIIAVVLSVICQLLTTSFFAEDSVKGLNNTNIAVTVQVPDYIFQHVKSIISVMIFTMVKFPFGFLRAPISLCLFILHMVKPSATKITNAPLETLSFPTKIVPNDMVVLKYKFRTLKWMVHYHIKLHSVQVPQINGLIVEQFN